MTTAPIVVVGAGPTGLTTALVLARSGTPVRVVSADRGPVVESRALVVHARTLELWHKLGLADAALDRGQPLREAYGMVSGRPMRHRFLDLTGGGRDVTPFATALVLEQFETEQLLHEALTAAGVDVEWGTRLTALAQDDDGVDLTVTRPGGAVERLRASWVVGADGARSTVRHELGLDFVGKTNPEAFFLADVDLRWRHGRERFWANLSRETMLLLFPMRGGDRFRVIGVLPERLAAAADGPGLALDDVRSLVTDVGGVEAELDHPRWITTYRIHHRRAERFRAGRVFLAGDSAHVHSPAGGQGMNTGIGDGYNLAWKLARVAGGVASPALLDSYEPERVPLADALLRNTDRLFALQASPSRTVVWLRQRLLPVVLPVLHRFRRTLFRLISQAWVTYRTSPAVLEAAARRGPVRAGDRAPWAHLPDGTDLFDLLVGPDSHLLAFPADGTGGGTGGGPDLAADARELAATEPALSAHVLGPEAAEVRARYGIRPGSDAVVLVRPDGHIGLRSQPADVGLLRAHLAGHPSSRERPVAAGHG